VRKRLGIQSLPVLAPTGEMTIHQRDEPVIVMPLDKVRQFVDEDVFKALGWFLCEFKI
jgi:hypothetical protein